jgi:hypothetical protein
MKKAHKTKAKKKPPISKNRVYKVRTDTGWEVRRLGNKRPDASRDYEIATDSSFTMHLSYKTIHELLIKGNDVLLPLSEPVKERGIINYLFFPKDQGEEGIEIKISADVASVICSAIELHTPQGFEGLVSAVGESCMKHFLEGLLSFLPPPHQGYLPECSEACQKGELKSLLTSLIRTAVKNSAPKIKNTIRANVPNVNERKIRRLFEDLNALSQGNPFPERKKKLGRPTKAEEKIKKTIREEKSRKLFARHKKKDDTK